MNQLMRTTIINLAKALEGRYQVMTEDMTDGVAVVIRSMDGRWITERRFTHRQTANKELLEIILSDVRNQLLYGENARSPAAPSHAGVPASVIVMDEVALPSVTHLLD